MKKTSIFILFQFLFFFLIACAYYLPMILGKKYQSKTLHQVSSSAYKLISKKPYSKTVDYMLQNEQFEEKFLEDYYQIIFQDTANFANNINIFLSKNYSPEEINAIYTMHPKNIDILLHQEYINISPYIQYTNIELDKLNRYQEYMTTQNISLEHAITQVNIGLDQPFYTNYSIVDNLNSIAVLVNKYHSLPANYVPDDLVSLSYQPYYKMRKEAADHFEEMIEVARINGHYIYPYSPYRSYERQKELYDAYVIKDGKNLADTYSARPGFSEHQTGLTVDVRSAGHIDNLNHSDYEWIIKNGPSFGFIIRYPKDKTNITGYKNEPWHLRYVGEKIAKEIQQLNITFDEYYDLYLKN